MRNEIKLDPHRHPRHSDRRRLSSSSCCDWGSKRQRAFLSSRSGFSLRDDCQPFSLRTRAKGSRLLLSIRPTPSDPFGSQRPPRRPYTQAARQSAMEVSSVQSPGLRWNGPPPVISASGANVPGGLNSKVVPKASPAANPSRAPRYPPLRQTRMLLAPKRESVPVAAWIA